MAGRVGVDILAVEFLGTKSQCGMFGGGHVFDHDVQVSLLRDRWIRPGWGAVVWVELEGQAGRGVVGGNDDPVVALVSDRLSEQLRVEGSQGGRVGAVEHHMVQSSEHCTSFTDAVLAPATLLLSNVGNRWSQRPPHGSGAGRRLTDGFALADVPGL